MVFFAAFALAVVLGALVAEGLVHYYVKQYWKKVWIG